MNNETLRVQGTSVCQVTLIGIMVVLLYASRACYNLVVLALADIQTINSFDYDWYNVSDQVGQTLNQLFMWCEIKNHLLISLTIDL